MLGIHRRIGDPNIIVDVHTDFGAIEFRAKTYRRLSETTGPVLWQEYYATINAFLATLDAEQQAILAAFYQGAHDTLAAMKAETLEVTRVSLGRAFNHAVDQTQLIRRLLAFVQSGAVPMPDLSEAGGRVQDTDAMTFYAHDAEELTVIALVCKLLSPVWGEFIYASSAYVNNVDKELLALGVMVPCLERQELKSIREKLYFYSDRSAENVLKRKTSSDATSAPMTNKSNAPDDGLRFSLSSRGMGTKRLFDAVLATVVVKKLTNYTWRADSNIVTYLWSAINETMPSLLQPFNMKKKDDIQAQVQQGAGSEYQDNTSGLEHASQTSSVPISLPVIIREGVRMMRPALLKRAEMSEEALTSAMLYYSQSPLLPTQFNKALIGSFLGFMIGGTPALEHIRLDVYTELVSLTQLALAKRGMMQIAVLISATPAMTPRTEADTSVEARIRASTESSEYFRMLSRAFPMSIGGASIRTQVTTLREFIIGQHHYANVPDVVGDLVDQEIPAFGSRVVYTDTVVHELVRFLHDCHLQPLPEGLLPPTV